MLLKLKYFPLICNILAVAAAGFSLAGGTRASAASPPSGTDAALITPEDTPLVLRAADFGFSDAGDTPPNEFRRVKFPSLPAAGTLAVNGEPVAAGDFVPVRPVAGMIWNSVGVPGLQAQTYQSYSVASSADGNVLAALVRDRRLAVSADAGGTWRLAGPQVFWNCVAVSADGKVLAAGEFGGPIYVSKDGGLNWTVTGTPNSTWGSVTVSADGSRLAAFSIQGQYYLSTDSGAIWTTRSMDTNPSFAAASGDGMKLAVAKSGGVATSTDGGQTWTERPVAGNSFSAIASSADGTRLLLADWGPHITDENGQIVGGRLRISTDQGATWSPYGPTLPWTAASSSADGLNLIAAADGGRLYTSTDGGMTWTPRDTERLWRAVASSADGTKLIAALDGQPLMLSSPALPVITFTPAANQFGTPYTQIHFQVEDDGAAGANLDPSPNTFTVSVAPVPDAPMASGSLEDQVAAQGRLFQFGFAENFFQDGDAGDALTYSAGLSDGSPLPSWLTFNPASRSLSGTPSSADPGSLTIRITARDSSPSALSGSAEFHLLVSAHVPDGTDRAVSLPEDSSWEFNAAAFGFTDSNDSPPDVFQDVKITTLPKAGTLTVEDEPVRAGDYIPVTPVAGWAWKPGKDTGAWTALAASADGRKQIAAIPNAPLFLSSDGGLTWTLRGTPQYWTAVASSTDGTRLVAAALGGRLYTSSDSGQSWTARDSVRDWSGLASSADGARLVATESHVGEGRIYTSADYGVTWTARESLRYWRSVASSSDGTRLVATATSGPEADFIYVSSDAGVTWTPCGTPGSWIAVASSADGQRLIAVTHGALCTSGDFGATWKVWENSYYLHSVASSADGRKLIAAGNGRILISPDAGGTWSEHGILENWSAVISSPDGSRLAAAADGGAIHTSEALVPVLKFTPAADAFGAPYTSFTFQVRDNRYAGENLDPTPNTIALNVSPVNDAPVAVQAIPDQVAAKHLPFTYQIPSGVFTDVDPGTVFTWSAAMADGGPLPGWLHFAPGSRTFSGQPENGDVGTLELKVTVSDNGTPSLSATTSFFLTVPGSAPGGTDTALTLNEDSSYIFLPADFGFTDAGDNPPDQFHRIRLTTVPSVGTLSVEGVPLAAGDYVPLFPDARMLWTLRETNRNWLGIASSADGSKLAAIAHEGQIYTSTDSGETWIPRETARRWSGICSSGDGSRLAAVSYDSRIYISSDSGATWTARATARQWSAVACSADGMKLVAAAANEFLPLYTSSDAGVTWTARGESRFWTYLAMSADGTTILASASNDPLYLSKDFGLTWNSHETERPSWWALACSADGSRLMASADGKFFLSTDAGATWINREVGNFGRIASSADGLRIAGVSFDRKILVSTDGGTTWSRRDKERQWSAIASSADGLKLAATVQYGSIYTSVAAVPTLVYTPPANTAGQSLASFEFQVEDDGTGEATLDPVPNTITLNVNPVNDAPRLVAKPADAFGRENTPFSYQIFAGAFSDADSGDVLTYSARRTDGGVLPEWLTFDATTRTFSGTPGVRDTGALPVLLTVADNGVPSLSASASFVILINNADDPPSGADATIVLPSGTPHLFNPADFGFSDPLDLIPNHFVRVKVATLPEKGSLTFDGVAVAAGDTVEMASGLPGISWTARATTSNWTSIASSADGQKLVAVVDGGRIHTSADAGVTWTPRDATRSWYSVASSADGSRLAAVARGGLIYTSSDSGATWTSRYQSLEWRAITSSADGMRLTAIIFGGKIYTSSDAGVTWTARETNRQWYSVCSSADGLRQAAVVQDGLIYISADGGVTWSPTADAKKWRSIRSSADGRKLVAIVNGGRIYTSSDFGSSWTPRDESRNWYDAASSADGSQLAAVVQNGQVFLSDDSGASWRARDTARGWRAIACSDDGARLAAIVQNGQIFTSAPGAPKSFVYTPAGDGNGPSYTSSFTFQVGDDGATGANLDPEPRTLTLKVITPEDPRFSFSLWAQENSLPTDPSADGGRNLLRFAFGLNPGGGNDELLTVENGVVTSRGEARLLAGGMTGEADGFTVLFSRRKNSGLRTQVQFSADLRTWETSTTEPTVLGSDEVIEACELAFPAQLSAGQQPRFFRISVGFP